MLFLDELGEFSLDVLESLRLPLEEGTVRVARALHRVSFPARFLLVAAMNPCPCGEGLQPGRCRCGDGALLRYSRRLSGPLLDRFDLRIEVHPPDPEMLLRGEGGESTGAIAERVQRVRQVAATRGVTSNALLDLKQLDEFAPLSAEASTYLEKSMRAGLLSARGLRRVRSVALTLHDLREVPVPIDLRAVSMALQLRGEPRFLSRRMAS